MILVARDAPTIAVVCLLLLGVGAYPTHLPQVWFGAGIGSCTNTSALDLGALDFVRQGWLSAKEILVVVAVLVSSASQTLKAVQVELTLEAAHLGELEVDRKQFLEFFGLADDKAATVWLPANDILVAIGCDFVQHFMEANGEWSSHSTSCWTFVDAILFVGVVVVVMLHNDVRVLRLALSAAAAAGAGAGSLLDSGVSGG